MNFNISAFAFQKNTSPLRKIKIQMTKEKLTSAAGLGTIIELFDQSGVRNEFMKCLPSRTSPRSQGSYVLALNLICGFIHGFDCLDDHDDFKGDEAIQALFGEGTPKARTLGDLLRDFSDENLNDLNTFLGKMSWGMLASLNENLPEEHKPKYVCLDIDSTDHPQSGNKIEGVAWNYKHHWCLDSQVVYDQMGFCHGFQLRPGNTKSGVDAPELLDGALNDGKTQLKRKFEGKVFTRADSAYCNQEYIKTNLHRGALFTITANNATTGWKDLFASEGLAWQPHVYTEKELEWAEKKRVDLPQIDYTRIQWTPSWSQKEEKKLIFPIVIKRTLDKEKFEELRKKNSQLNLIGEDGYLKDDPYDYYAVVTNFPLDLATDKAQASESEIKHTRYYGLQEVIEHHAQRATCENFIREGKYGYDLKHLPCLKMNANRAYGLLAMVAHNLLRWVSLTMKPDKPHFAKKLRKRFVFYPGKILYRSRQIILKIVEQGFKEVMKLRETWGFQSEKISPQMSTA
jgi:hypothetical protein